ncbi:MAG: signal peptidase I [Myxococcota bacterium]
MASDEELEPTPTGMAWVREVVRAWAPAILAVFIIRAFIFEPFRIPSSSMVPTLLVGDHVLVTKFSYGVWLHFPFPRKLGIKSVEVLDLGDPERGDIIVFRYPENEALTYIKRVVALSGDRIRVKNNQIFLNDAPVERKYTGQYDFVDDRCRTHKARHYIEDLPGTPHEKLTNLGGGGFLADMDEITVPPDSVFVMGDNRDNSEDSRRWKFVRFDQVKGKARFIWLSLDFCSGGWPFDIRGERAFRGLYGEPDSVEPAP